MDHLYPGADGENDRRDAEQQEWERLFEDLAASNATVEEVGGILGWDAWSEVCERLMQRFGDPAEARDAVDHLIHP